MATKRLKTKESRIKIIPDILFHTLWDQAEKYESSYNYIKDVTRFDSEYIDKIRATGLDEDDIYLFLRQIHTYRHMDMTEILKAANTSKAKVSHIFCIPIRTLEDWCSKKNKCPGYAKLMVLKQFHQFKLGKYVRLESEIVYKESKPSVYTHSDDYELNKMLRNSKKSSPRTSTVDSHYYSSTLDLSPNKDSHPTYKFSYAEDYAQNPNKRLSEDMAYIDRLMKKRREKG